MDARPQTSSQFAENAFSSITVGCQGTASRPRHCSWELLVIVETNADERITAWLVFDPDDIDAAFAELDARYLAGEAAPHAHTWRVITRGLRRHDPR